MATQNSSNQKFTNQSDGFTLGGGSTQRDLTISGANITLAGSGSNTHTFPSSSDTLVGRSSTDTLTNKTIDGASNTLKNTTGMLMPVQACTLNNETFTISGGTVTQIAGTTINGYTPAVGDRILITGAPASTGTGIAFVNTTQPTNGIYTVTSNTTNLSVSRASDMSGSVNPAGLSVFIEAGTWNAGNVFSVLIPTGAGAFTYGSGNINWQSTGGYNPTFGYIFLATSTNSIGIYNGSGNTYVQPTGSVGNQTLTLPATATSDTLVGRASTDTLTNKTLTSPVINTSVSGSAVATAATASTLALRDSNANLTSDAFIASTTSTPTAAGTTTLDINSTQVQIFTGSSTQNVNLPTTSVVAGQTYTVVNQSSSAVTVRSSGANNILVLAANTTGLFTAVVNTPTTAAHWTGSAILADKTLTTNADLTLTGTDGKTLTLTNGLTVSGNDGTLSFGAASKTLSVNNSLTLAGTDATTMTFPSTTGNVIASATGIGTVSGSPSSSTFLRGDGTWSSAVAQLDANNNFTADTFITGTTSTATSAGILTMDINSTQTQVFTGSSTHTVKLPTTSVVAGQTYTVINQSTGGAITVQSSGANTISTLASNVNAVGIYTAVKAAPTAAADWESRIILGGKTLTTNNTLTLAGTDATTMTFPSTSATIARTDAAQTFTGVQTLSSSPVLSSGAVTVSSNTITFPTTADTLVGRATTDTLTNKTLTSARANEFLDINGALVLDLGATASAVNYLNIGNAASGSSPTIDAIGAGTNIDINLQPKGTGRVQASFVNIPTISSTDTLTNKTLTAPKIVNGGYIADANGNEQIIFNTTASAVNEITLINGATGTGPQIKATGGDTNVNLNFYSKGSADINFFDDGGRTMFQIDNWGSTSAVNFVYVNNSNTGSGPTVGSWGSDTNIDLNLLPRGSGIVKANSIEVATISGTQTLTNKTLTTPKIDAIKDTNGNAVASFSATASAVNSINFVNNSTGNAPAIYATGSDTNVGLWIQAKGSSSIYLGDGSGNTMFAASKAASAVNWMEVKNAATGTGPSITAFGSDTNVDLNLIPKGSGVVKANGYEVMTAANGGRLVVATQSGGTGASDGANTWVKIATYSTGTIQFDDCGLTLAVTTNVTGGLDSAIVSVFFRSNNTGTDPTVQVDMLAKGGSNGLITADSFKVISGAWSTNMELWFKKGAQWGGFSFYEISRKQGNGTLTYNNGAAWQSATPSGAVNNVSTNGVNVFGDPVVGTTGTQSLSNKTLNSFKLNGHIYDGSGNLLIENDSWSSSAVNYIGVENSPTANNYVKLNVKGTDTNIKLQVAPKGTGVFEIWEGTGQATATLAAAGSATNVDLNLTSQGTGVVKANGVQLATTTNVPVEGVVITNNLLASYNPSFDTNLTGWNQTGSWTYDGTTGHNANGSAKIVADGTTKAISSTTIPVTVGTRYTLEVWISGSSLTNTTGDINLWVESYTGATLQGSWWADGYQNSWGTKNNPTGTFGWYRLFGQYIPTTGEDGIRLVVNAGSAITAGSIWVDDARITVSGISKEMVNGLGDEIDDLWNGSGTIGNKTLNNTNTITVKDANFTLQDDADTTKTIVFSLGGMTTATSITLNAPNTTGSATLVTRASTDTLTNKRITPRITSITSSATPTFNTDNTDLLDITALATNITSMTSSMTGTPTNGQKLMVRIKGDATPRTIAWGASFQSSGMATLLATTVANKEHHVLLVYATSVAKWVCLAVDSAGY